MLPLRDICASDPATRMPGACVEIRVALASEKLPWFHEIAHALVDALRDGGRPAELVVDAPRALELRWRGRRFHLHAWIVLTPELFTELPRGSVAYNFEQLDARASHVAPAALAHLVRVCAHAGVRVWDFSSRNARFWAEAGVPYTHVPLGYTPCMTYPVSIEGAHDACVFLGNVYGRRARILDKLRARLGARLRVVSDAFCYGDSYYAPAASSAAKLATLAGARVVVNIKPVEPALTCTETPRLWWCVANRVFVVSETDNDAEARAPFEEAGLVFARTSDELVEAVVEIMSEPRERTRARAENALAYARRRCAFGKSLLVATGEHSSS